VEYSHSIKKGLIHVYTGNGKGKTTTALGLALRAIGHNFSVYIIQFLKGGSYLGELAMSEKLGPKLHIMQFGKDCIHAEKLKKGIKEACGECRYCFIDTASDKVHSEFAFERAKRVTKSGLYDLVIVDEINVAVAKKLLSVEQVLGLMTSKHPNTELIMTGRDADPSIIGAADLVTEMRDIKHPMNTGTGGRRGIEY